MFLLITQAVKKVKQAYHLFKIKFPIIFFVRSLQKCIFFNLLIVGDFFHSLTFAFPPVPPCVGYAGLAWATWSGVRC